MNASTPNVQHNQVDPLDRELAPGWIHHDAGDRVRGVVTDLGQYDGGYGLYPVVTIRLADGHRAEVADKHGGWVEPGEEVAIHCGPTVLRNEMAKIRPKIGDEIGVKRGELVTGARNPYPRFRVVRYGDEPALDWSRFSDEEPAEGTTSAEREATAILHRPLEDDAETQAALERELDERDAAASE